MSNKTILQTNNTNLQSFIDRINAAKDTAASLPEASGVETCNVTINAPGVTVIGWGEFTLSTNGSTSAPASMPSTKVYYHTMPIEATYNFPSLPVGSTFVFYYGGYIKGATVSDNIEFSFVEVDTIPDTDYKFAICRCNGDGEITINI